MRKDCQDLSWFERQELYRLLNVGKGIRELGRILKRNPSTISRDIKNLRLEAGYHPRLPWYEKARLSHESSRRRRGRPRDRSWKLKNAAVSQYVHLSLADKLSPKSISLKLGKDLPGESISHETIYQYIYKVDRSLLKYLVRAGNTKRNNRASKQKNRLRQAELQKERIDKRPKEANNRSEPGHLESDFIVSCKGGAACLMVVVDRAHRKVYLRKTLNREAEVARCAIFGILNKLPAELRKTLTIDNDKAHNHLPLLEPVFKDSKFKVFWCNPYCSWERGTVEAINGIIRRWFPKGTNFDEVDEQLVQYVEDWFNQRPMEVLGGQSPSEVVADYFKKAA